MPRNEKTNCPARRLQFHLFDTTDTIESTTNVPVSKGKLKTSASSATQARNHFIDSNHKLNNHQLQFKETTSTLNRTHSISSTAKNELINNRTEATHLDHSTYWTRRPRKKLKQFAPTARTHRMLLLLTFIVFTSLGDFLICVAQGVDVTGLIRVSDDENAQQQKLTDLGITSDPLAPVSNGRSNSGTGAGLYSGLEKIGSLEMSIAAVFNKVAYGTTTKRSIADNVFVPNLTTVPTPQLTTYRYREKEKESDKKPSVSTQHHQYQQHSPSQKHPNYNNKYSLDLEHDHALPTSAPNADILKSNSNPTYPNPNRHHNHGDRHRPHLNSTPAPSAHNLLTKGQATIPMYPAELPSYSPPARSFFTPRLPSEYYQNQFAEQPTLRGTNSESGVNSGFNINRRPIPPPSLMPGQEKIPLRPPDLKGNTNNANTPKNKHHGVQMKEPDPHTHNLNNESERKKALNTPAQKPNQNRINSNQMPTNTSDVVPKSGILHFPSISRILSGSNGRKEDIPEVLLRTVTARPSYPEVQSSLPPRDPFEKAGDDDDLSSKGEDNDGDFSRGDDGGDDTGGGTSAEDDFDSTTFNGEEPKTQPKIKQGSATSGSNNGQKNPNAKKLSTESPLHQSDMVYSTQIIQNLAATNTDKKLKQTPVAGNSKITTERSALTTWAVAWNIHVYLSAILFTILAVYSIFKMIFYDKLTHLVNQSYFICLHMILIIICLARIFFLCYDAYNIHFSFHLFISELLLNLPATFLTVSFSVLILFLLLRSLNHKNNRYSALMRPLTVVVGSAVHVILCITLHYVESYGQQQRNQHIQYQQQLLRNNGEGYRGGNQAYIYNAPPRVLSLICQLIYIFICFSLGVFYLYVYKILKRVLHKKSQNYIHGYQNLSYAIHITIATALLFILLAALQIYGAISISTTRPIMSSLSDNDWQQWGYQFSLRLIEIAIIALLSWVTGLKTGATKVLQRDKVMEQHNVSGFALFPCTSSSSQEHFETDYPAICNANTNLHSYTLRTGKPLYDDTFALNSLGMENPIQIAGANAQLQHHHHHHHMHPTNTATKNSQYKSGHDYPVQQAGQPHSSDTGIYDANSGTISKQNNRTTPTFAGDGRGQDHMNDSGTIPDHYENPNFELHSSSNTNYRKNIVPLTHGGAGSYMSQQQQHSPNADNCYTEPIGAEQMYCSKGDVGNAGPPGTGPPNGYDFQNFERPSYMDRTALPAGSSINEFRASKNLKALVKSNSNNYDQHNQPLKQNNLGGKSAHYGAQQAHNYNSFERRGIRKSGTLNNIGNGGSGGSGSGSGGGGNGGHAQTSVRNNAMSTLNINSNASGRSLGVRTLNAPRSQYQHKLTKDRHQSQLPSQRSNNFIASPNEHGDEIVNDYADNLSNASSEGIRYNPDMVLYKAQRGSSEHQQQPSSNLDNAPNSASSGDSASSMLVAEHGFVRFRPMDDMGNRSGSSSLNSDNNNIMNKNSPAIMQRHHKRSLTNS